MEAAEAAAAAAEEAKAAKASARKLRKVPTSNSLAVSRTASARRRPELLSAGKKSKPASAAGGKQAVSGLRRGLSRRTSSNKAEG